MIPDWLDAAIERAKRGPYRADASEFIFGRGLTSPGLEDAPPSKDGRYHGPQPRQCMRHSDGRVSEPIACARALAGKLTTTAARST